jgi:hypothetical protein
VLAVAAALGLGLAACGGGGPAAATTTWADAACTSLTLYGATIQEVIDVAEAAGRNTGDVKPDRDTVVAALDGAHGAATTGAERLTKAPVPKVTDGGGLHAQVVDQFNALATETAALRAAVAALPDDRAAFVKGLADVVADAQGTVDDLSVSAAINSKGIEAAAQEVASCQAVGGATDTADDGDAPLVSDAPPTSS